MNNYGIYGVIHTCETIIASLYDVAEPIIDYLGNTYNLFGNSYSLFDLIFGLGIPIVLGATMIKWLVGIVT